MHSAVVQNPSTVLMWVFTVPGVLNWFAVHVFSHHPHPQTWACWMVADPKQGQPGAVGASKIATALRAWSGDMSSIKVPAKWAARLGQCFSATVDAARLDDRTEVGAALTRREVVPSIS